MLTMRFPICFCWLGLPSYSLHGCEDHSHALMRSRLPEPQSRHQAQIAKCFVSLLLFSFSRDLNALSCVRANQPLFFSLDVCFGLQYSFDTGGHFVAIYLKEWLLSLQLCWETVATA